MKTWDWNNSCIWRIKLLSLLKNILNPSLVTSCGRINMNHKAILRLGEELPLGNFYFTSGSSGISFVQPSGINIRLWTICSLPWQNPLDHKTSTFITHSSSSSQTADSWRLSWWWIRFFGLNEKAFPDGPFSFMESNVKIFTRFFMAC